ncbi:hypothetical protein CALVIDRAFT_79531 [Calocera viscosa TUFC12733]|uniref:Uncharacterized protein n=1 Tax=Calocera viscosa (strain TUFC12733) TaxID=1330018 RepID=A0A167N0B8_CALVF|nr:hypothetical protein CALVIDRAFT_79531 [Calocera viscosa TUFC12733]
MYTGLWWVVPSCTLLWWASPSAETALAMIILCFPSTFADCSLLAYRTLMALLQVLPSPFTLLRSFLKTIVAGLIINILLILCMAEAVLIGALLLFLKRIIVSVLQTLCTQSDNIIYAAMLILPILLLPKPIAVLVGTIRKRTHHRPSNQRETIGSGTTGVMRRRAIHDRTKNGADRNVVSATFPSTSPEAARPPSTPSVTPQPYIDHFPPPSRPVVPSPPLSRPVVPSPPPSASTLASAVPPSARPLPPVPGHHANYASTFVSFSHSTPMILQSPVDATAWTAPPPYSTTNSIRLRLGRLLSSSSTRGNNNRAHHPNSPAVILPQAATSVPLDYPGSRGGRSHEPFVPPARTGSPGAFPQPVSRYSSITSHLSTSNLPPEWTPSEPPPEYTVLS